MEGEPGEASFEGLMEAGHDVSAVDDHFDPNTITHAMITPDGTTVPITLNPETGQFMTPDGQAVQVQMQSDETEYMDDSESVLPDPQDVEGVHTGMDHGHETSSFQVMSAADAVVQQGPPQAVMVKTEENYPMQIDQSSVQVSDGNIQVLSSDGSMYFVSNDMVEAPPQPTIQMMPTNTTTASGHTIVDTQSLHHGGKIRIVNNDDVAAALQPTRKIITINNQQYVVSQGGQGVTPKATNSSHFEKPKVVIRPAIAPKTEPKVQYVKVMGSKPIQQYSNERKVVTIRSGSSGMPILPKDSGNILRLALPTSSDNRIQKTQRIILPSQISESVKVVEATGTSHLPLPAHLAHLAQPRKVVSMDQVTPKIEPSSIVTTTIETPRPAIEKMPDIFESTGVKPRKPCNCTKSQCLKLYCECFANGEFCNNCNCNNCFNNLAHEEARQRSIKQCLERNANAFRPKIGKLNNEGDRRHAKGCNCKRSGCLKNYCECYEAKIGCTKNCRCIGCKNIEVGSAMGTSRKPDPDQSLTISSKDSNNAGGDTSSFPRKNESSGSIKARINPLSSVSGNSFKPVSGVRQPFNFVTNEVVEATCQCLLAQAEQAESSGKEEVEIEGLIIEEFGRCLGQIIEMANKSLC